MHAVGLRDAGDARGSAGVDRSSADRRTGTGRGSGNGRRYGPGNGIGSGSFDGCHQLVERDRIGHDQRRDEEPHRVEPACHAEP